jgi:hypothetical protein
MDTGTVRERTIQTKRKRVIMTHSEKMYKLGQIETIMNLLTSEIEQHNARANWEAASREYQARMTSQRPAVAPTPAALPENPTYAQVVAAARAPRRFQLQSIEDPLVHSPGSTVRMGK